MVRLVVGDPVDPALQKQYDEAAIQVRGSWAKT